MRSVPAHLTWRMSSSSMAMFRGSSAAPRARRAWRPASPKIWTRRSDAPLMTAGCWVKPSAEATWPDIRTTRLIRSRLPSSCLAIAKAFNSVSFAASYPCSTVRSLPSFPAKTILPSLNGPVPLRKSKSAARTAGTYVATGFGAGGRVIFSSANLASNDILDDRGAWFALNQLDLVPVRRVDEDEAAAGGRGGRAVGDLDALGLQGPDGLVQVVHLKREVDQIFLDSDRPARREAAELDQLLAVRHFEEGQMRAARRRLALQHLQAEHLGVEPDGLVHVAHPHPGMQQLLHPHRSAYLQIGSPDSGEWPSCCQGAPTRAAESQSPVLDLLANPRSPMDLARVHRRSECEWEIAPTGTMRVPAVIYATEPLIRDMDD